MDKKYSNFLFDMDGTLIDSFEDIKYSLEKSYAAVLGRSVTLSRNNIGPPLMDMINELSPKLSEETKTAIVKEFRSIYDNSSYDLTKEMKGSFQVLQNLHRMGNKLFLVTNKAYAPTLRILGKMKFDFFVDVVAPDKFKGRPFTKAELIKRLIDTYYLDLDKTVMIGDTAQDVIAAKANLIDSISIIGGYDSVENLRQEKPTRIVQSIGEL